MGNKQVQEGFVPGLELAEGFFREEVEPILESHYPHLSYSAALIGSGSEVLGFDTRMSADHHWGPRVMLFLRPEDFGSRREEIRTALSKLLPVSYRGFSTNFSEPDPEDRGTQVLQPVSSGPINHRVEIFTIAGFLADYINIQVDAELDALDWLTLPHQKLRSIVAGRVFRDDLGLEAVRARFAWYPHDVWLYLLVCGWSRIGQEEHLMGRAGFVGDDMGCALIASRLVRDVMRLAFLMEKEYPPYPKWFGTAFSRLRASPALGPVLKDVLSAPTWRDREAGLSLAYEMLAGMHNELHITEPLPAKVTPFFDRPFKVIGADHFAGAIRQRIADPRLAALAQGRPIGNVDLFSDNTDLLENASLRPALRALYA
jgi:hypothetical protein